MASLCGTPRLAVWCLVQRPPPNPSSKPVTQSYVTAHIDTLRQTDGPPDQQQSLKEVLVGSGKEREGRGRENMSNPLLNISPRVGEITGTHSEKLTPQKPDQLPTMTSLQSSIDAWRILMKQHPRGKQTVRTMMQRAHATGDEVLLQLQ